MPTLGEFRDERRSRRRAYLACIAVFHLRDHLKKADEMGIENAMRGACGLHSMSCGASAMEASTSRGGRMHSVSRGDRQRSAACGLGRGKGV